MCFSNKKKDIKTLIMNEDEINLQPSGFRITLLTMIILLIPIRLFDIFVYPEFEIIPSDFFMVVVIVLMFFIWFDGVKEKQRILWVQKKKNDLNHMKWKFTALTSHELMTPIIVIKGYMQLLLNESMGELSEEQKKSLTTMNRYFERLEGIRSKLTSLYFGKFSELTDKFEPVSIEELVRVTSEDILPFVKKRGQSLSIKSEKDIAPAMMNPVGIRQVLVNLILNAIRFTPDGGKIILRTKDDVENVKVEVEDNGIGIAKDKLKTIFESFYEAQDTFKHSSGTIEFKSGGMGLGLTIAKNIVESHNGKIWVESTLDKGTKVVFIVPKK